MSMARPYRTCATCGDDLRLGRDLQRDVVELVDAARHLADLDRLDGHELVDLATGRHLLGHRARFVLGLEDQDLGPTPSTGASQ